MNMLFEICQHIRNFFPEIKNRIDGDFTISGGAITPTPDTACKYFLIEGSALNDGIKTSLTGLEDESFTGSITPLKLPADFVALCEEIATYNTNNAVGPYTSESFGGYSYSKATTSTGAPITWREAYATRLNAWRKI